MKSGGVEVHGLAADGVLVAAAAFEIVGRALLAVGEATFEVASVLGRRPADPEDYGRSVAGDGEFRVIPRYSG